MADLIKIGESLINMNQVTKATLDFQTHRQDKCVMLYFSDGRELLLDSDRSEKFRAYLNLYIDEGEITGID